MDRQKKAPRLRKVGCPEKVLKIDAYAGAARHIRAGLAFELQPDILAQIEIYTKTGTERILGIYILIP